MKRLKVSKKGLVAAVAGAAIAATLVAVPAQALYYVHGDAGDAAAADDGSHGAVEVICTLDQRAIGGRQAGIWTSAPVFVPSGGTAKTALDEAMFSSESQQGLKAIHNYDYQSYTDKIKKMGGTWKFTIYHAESQKPGTQTTQDNRNKDAQTVSFDELDNVTLQRYDQVVATLEKK